MHIDGRNKNILSLGEWPTQDLENTTITAEAKYSINVTKSGKKDLCEVYIIMELIAFYLLIQYSEIKLYPLCLGNISKNFALNNI